MRLFVFEKQETVPSGERPDLAVIIDVLRATSTIVTALANGVKAVRPVKEVREAFALKPSLAPPVLLAGERQAVPPPGFDLGNSPLPFLDGHYRGHTVIACTSNGTRAIRLLSDSRRLWLGSLLNAAATGQAIGDLAEAGALETVWLVCAGTMGEFTLDDFLCAGAIADMVLSRRQEADANDQARAARLLWRSSRDLLPDLLAGCRHGARLCRMGLQADVRFCAQYDRYPILAEWDHGTQTLRARHGVESSS